MADKVIQNATGGQYASTHVAGASGAAIAYTGGGRLCGRRCCVSRQGSLRSHRVLSVSAASIRALGSP